MKKMNAYITLSNVPKGLGGHAIEFRYEFASQPPCRVNLLGSGSGEL